MILVYTSLFCFFIFILDKIVGESIIVIQRLLIQNPEPNPKIIKKLINSLEHISIPMAQASILWIAGQYSQYLLNVVPDIFRKYVGTFMGNSDIVKLSTLTLGVKLVYVLGKVGSEDLLICRKLFEYLLELARFDKSFDIRDRARLFKNFEGVDDGVVDGILFSRRSLEKFEFVPIGIIIVLLISNNFLTENNKFTLGSLSHSLNQKVNGYQDLPPWSSVTSDSRLRDVEEENIWGAETIIQVVPAVEMKRPVTMKKRVVDLNEFYEESEREEESSCEDEASNEEDVEEHLVIKRCK